MNTPNFGALLDTPVNEVERPKPVPVGPYLCVNKALPKMDKTTKKQTEYVEFTLTPVQPLDGVDPEALEAMGGIADKTFRATFYITEAALWRLKEFLADMGIDTESGASLRELIDQTPGQQVIVNIKHTMGDDGKSIYAEIGSTQKVA